jgi:hypothetical protein
VIITGDFNEDVRSKPMETFFAELQMKEIILEQHGKEAPNTYMEVSVPIDGIFGTIGIEEMHSGYGAFFSEGMYSDHRLLWVDLDMDAALETTAIPLWRPRARRLQCNNPTIVNKFNQLRAEHHQKNELNMKRATMDLLLSQQVHEEQWKGLLEELDKLRVEGILLADHHCRKLKMGHVPWSPDLQRSMNKISYLQRCRLKYCLGKYISS